MGGCCSPASSKPSKLSDDPSKYPLDALIIRVDRGTRIPNLDLYGESDPYVRIRTQNRTLAMTSYKRNEANPVWNEVLDISGARLDDDVVVELWDHDSSKLDDKIGFVRISTRDLIKRPSVGLILNQPGFGGDMVVRKDGDFLPAEIFISIIKVPVGWPEPTPSPFEGDVDRKMYPKHIMVMTRGTRGDVQPYVALARGLAETFGWCVTICTELRYKDFVVKYGAGLTRGAIRYRPSGGDTHSRIDKPIARWAMAHQSELMQIAMLARTEREFFASEPIFFHWAQLLRPDAVVYGFTLVSCAMILSEKLGIPIVGFILQPTVIPSQQYPPVNCIDTHMLKWFDGLEHKVANHDFNLTLKQWMENDPIWAPLTHMRERRGLKPIKGKQSQTFSILLEQGSPVVVPINPVAFGGRPADWPACIEMTDFIFLQGGATPKLSTEIIEFIDNAHEAGDPVVAMTFSSMPVSRGDIIKSALKIVKNATTHPRVIALAGAKIRDKLPSKVQAELNECIASGKILELEGAPFGILFEKLDAVCVHGGLGTTAEAFRAGIPTTVVGVLLMDQRFWGAQCEKLGVGHRMVHIATWKRKCVGVVDEMLTSDAMKSTARELADRIKPRSADGVEENVHAIARALDIARVIDTTEIKERRGSIVSYYPSLGSYPSHISKASEASRASEASSAFELAPERSGKRASAVTSNLDSVVDVDEYDDEVLT